MKQIISKHKILLLSLSLLLVLGVSFWFSHRQPKVKEKFYEMPAVKAEDIHVNQLEGGRIITIESPHDYDRFEIGQEKFYQQEWRMRANVKGDDDRQKKGEYYYLHPYQIDTKKAEKKIDIFALVRKYNPKMGIQSPGDGEVIHYQGKDYLHITLTEKKKGKRTKLKEVMIDLVSGEVMDYVTGTSKLNYITAINRTKLAETLRERYNVIIKDNLLTYLLDNHTNIPSDLNMSQESPDLVKKLNQGKIQLFVRQGDKSQEEWFNILMHWFAPQGEDRLSLVITDPETKEVTPIHSYQDYLSWLETQPKNKIYKEVN